METTNLVNFSPGIQTCFQSTPFTVTQNYLLLHITQIIAIEYHEFESLIVHLTFSEYKWYSVQGVQITDILILKLWRDLNNE